MSALRDLLASLWTTLWIHARLLRIRVRRLFGRGSAPEAGVDYHLTKAETPVEGVDYDLNHMPAELRTRLEGARADLAAGAAGAPTSNVPHRRRRTASLVVASLLSLGAVAAGASALVSGSTGVPAIDRALGIYEAELARPQASERPGPSGSDLQPDSSGSSTSIDVPMGDGPSIVTGFYVARDGKICAAFADGEGDQARPVVNCTPPQALHEQLDAKGVSVLTIRALGDKVVVIGFASSQIADLRGRGPGGVLDLRIGSSWTPRPKAVEALKPFVAVGPNPDVAPTGREFPRSLDPRSYAFEAAADDGSRIQIAP